jgi:hypothetical protein
MISTVPPAALKPSMNFPVSKFVFPFILGFPFNITAFTKSLQTYLKSTSVFFYYIIKYEFPEKYIF